MPKASDLVMNPDNPTTRKKFQSLRDLLHKDAELKYSNSEEHLEIVRTAARRSLEEKQKNQSADDAEKYKCPACEKWFAREDMMYISPNLRGDSVLGPDAEFRFLPTHFDDKGRALDANGNHCSDIACPHCHRKLPDTWAGREMMLRISPKLNESNEIPIAEKKRK